MQTALHIALIILIALTLWDVFITVFSTNGAGPITRLWTRSLWKGLFFIHRRRPIHRVLSVAGPFMLLFGIILWYTLLGVGFFMVLAANPGSVINSSTGEEADVLRNIYFVSTTISSLGYGDLVPTRFPWTMISTIGTLTATLVLTISLSYVLSVLGAAVECQKIAQGVFGMGGKIPDIIDRMRLGSSTESLKNYVLNLASEIDGQAIKHFAYPILRYFHSTRANSSLPRAMLLLSDTFFVLKVVSKEYRPSPGVRQLMESSIGNYAKFAGPDTIKEPMWIGCPDHLLEAARKFGLPDGKDTEFKKSIDAYLPQRNRLVALCRDDGWEEK